MCKIILEKHNDLIHIDEIDKSKLSNDNEEDKLKLQKLQNLELTRLGYLSLDILFDML